MHNDGEKKDAKDAGVSDERETEALERMVSRAKRIAEILKNFMGTVRIVTHHDADGICSAAIMARALAREGKTFHISIIKQLYEKNILELESERNRLIVFLDMGSGQLELIQKYLLKDGARIIIADHHQVRGEIVSEDVLHLNPTDFGIDENISGSGTTYLIARAMSPENRDLSEVAIIGAIGDSQTGSIGPHWGLLGLNKEILKDAETMGKIKVGKGLRIWGRTTRPIHKALEYSVDPSIPGVSGSESGAVHFLQELGIEIRNENGEWRTLSDLDGAEMEKLVTGIIKERIRDNHENPEWIFGDVYDLLDKGEMGDANEFATILNSAGKQEIGYIGIALCLNDREYFPGVGDMLDRYRREIGKSMRWVEKNQSSIKRTEFANYILAGGSVSEHVASNVISIISHSPDLLPETERGKLLFMMVENDDGEVKVSARASDDAEGAVSLHSVVSEAATNVGGEGGGHAGAAGASIPKGSEEMFINSIEVILKKVFKEKEREAEHGTAETVGRAGREDEGRAPEGKEGNKKDERKGLVRYIGA